MVNAYGQSGTQNYIRVRQPRVPRPRDAALFGGGRRVQPGDRVPGTVGRAGTVQGAVGPGIFALDPDVVDVAAGPARARTSRTQDRGPRRRRPRPCVIGRPIGLV